MDCSQFHLFCVWVILWGGPLCISETKKAENDVSRSKRHAFQLKIYLLQINFALKTFHEFFWGFKYNYFWLKCITFLSRLFNSWLQKNNRLLNSSKSFFAFRIIIFVCTISLCEQKDTYLTPKNQLIIITHNNPMQNSPLQITNPLC